MIEISHNREQGTLVEGTAKGDGTAQILRAEGFRFSRNLDAWYVPHSRRRAAKTWIINPAAAKLRGAGYEVIVTIDDTTPASTSFAEHEAAGYEHARDRADRYGDRAERAGANAQALEAEAKRRAEAIPFGQPILIDHHSEKRDRRYREGIRAKFDQSAQEAGRAHYWKGRRKAAESYEAGRENLGVTLRRIEKLEAEQRRAERDMARTTNEEYRERRAADLRETNEQLAYWRNVVTEAEAQGVKVWRKEDFAKGDYVLFHGTWWEVLRVNPKSLTIPHGLTGIGEPIMNKERAKGRRMGEYTDKLPYDKVTGRMSAEEARALLEATAKPEE